MNQLLKLTASIHMTIGEELGFLKIFFYLIPRSSSLAHVNAMLREQLDQATAANQSLTGDIHKLTADWQRAREDLEIKENEWRDEEQVRRKVKSVVNS